MKQCKNCSNQVNDGVKFCPNCGSTEFLLSQAQTPNFNTANASYTNGGMQQPQKKNTPWVPIVIIVLVIAIAAVAIVLLTNKKSDDSDKKDDTSISETADAKTDGTTTTTTTSPSVQTPTSPIQGSVPYTIGTFSGNTYINEWANLKVDIPAGWDIENKLQSMGSDGDFAFGAGDDNNKLAIMFTQPFDAQELAQYNKGEVEEELLKMMYRDFESRGYTIEHAGQPATEAFGREVYDTTIGEFSYEGETGYMMFAIRQCGDRYIMMMFFTLENDESKMPDPRTIIQSVH